MPEFLLTPASIGYLNQVLLSILIIAHLTKRHFTPGHRPSPRHESLLLLFFFWAALFSLLMFLEVSLLPTERLIIVYSISSVLSIQVLTLVQFAYYFPTPREEQRTERMIALVISTLIVLTELGFAIWRFDQLQQGQVEFRPNQLDIPIALSFLWVTFIFFRMAIPNWHVPTYRRLAWTFSIPFFLVVLNVAQSFNLITSTAFQITTSLGILFTIFFFALNYLTSQPERTSLITKISGAVLTSVLAVFGTVAWLVAPAYAAQFTPAIFDHRTIRFVPNNIGGYDIRELPFHFEQDFGQKLDLADEAGDADRKLYNTNFIFPFFGKPYNKICISNDGAIALGGLFSWKDHQNGFTDLPMMLPLLVDLKPQASPQSGVFMRQDTDQIIITYANLSAYNHPESIYTFQVVLYADGSFDFTYNGLPDLHYFVDDRPEATAWAIGIKPSEPSQTPMRFTDLPYQSGPAGAIQNEYHSFRLYLHEFIWPLAVAVVLSGLIFLVGLPLTLNVNFVYPLNVLLKGVQAFNSGQRGETIPIPVNDEIGFLTESFNRMSAELDSLITDLETRVTTRTSDLLAANEELRKLSIAVEQSPSTIIITDPNGSIEYVNPAFTLSTGYTFEEVKGQTPRILKSNHTPDTVYENLWKTITSGRAWRGELINKKKSDEIYWEYTVIAPITNSAGQTTHFVAIEEDITDRVNAEQALRESEERYRELFELESDAIFVIRNSDGQILEANNAASQLYGFSREEILTKRNIDLSAEPEATQQATNSPAPTDLVIQIPLRWHHKKDGTRFPVGITARFVTWRGESVHIAAIRDITEQHQIEQALLELATTDSLTGLFNRRYFLNRAREIFSSRKNPLDEISLIYMDLDHFKTVNDVFGHDVGDVALKQIAALLRHHVRPNDFLARFGGEEFIILLPRTSGKEAMQIAERLRATIEQSQIQEGDMILHVTTSMGVASTDVTDESFDLLLRHGDKALYKAKQAGRNCCIQWSADQ